MPVLIAFPATFRVRSAEFWRLTSRSTSLAQRSGVEQVRIWGGTVWRCRMELTPHTPSEADAIDSFLFSLESGEDFVQFSGADYNRPNGPGTLNWRLDRREQSLPLPRGVGGFSELHSVFWREIVA